MDIQLAGAEQVPYPDGTFDLTLAALVVHFMPDPVRGLTELARVTSAGGTVAATAWDFAGGRSPLCPFWRAARELDPAASDESDEAGARAGQLAQLFAAAGLRSVVTDELSIEVGQQSFESWWHPFTLGVGPAGAYLRGLPPAAAARLRERCAQLLPPAPFTIRATAWIARGLA